MCARTFSQGEPPSLKTVCSAELTGEERGLLSPGPGAKHGTKAEGAERLELTAAPTLPSGGQAWPSQPLCLLRGQEGGCMCGIDVSVTNTNQHLLWARLCSHHFYMLELI